MKNQYYGISIFIIVHLIALSLYTIFNIDKDLSNDAVLILLVAETCIPGYIFFLLNEKQIEEEQNVFNSTVLELEPDVAHHDMDFPYEEMILSESDFILENYPLLYRLGMLVITTQIIKIYGVSHKDFDDKISIAMKTYNKEFYSLLSKFNLTKEEIDSQIGAYVFKEK